jgi:hypothetical protein
MAGSPNAIPIRQRIRLYVDESGTHARPRKDLIGERYLGLVGVAFRQNETYTALHDAFRRLKFEHLDVSPDERICLHAEDIHQKRGRFVALREQERLDAFQSDFLDIVQGSSFRVFAVVVDKQSHFLKTYRKLVHPYHYAVHVLLERYYYWLDSTLSYGDTLFEARGGKENEALTAAYRQAMERGTSYVSKRMLQGRITSLEPKLQDKRDPLPGLELADMLARTATRDVVRRLANEQVSPTPYEGRLLQILDGKYYRDPRTGKIDRSGRVLLT